MDTPSDPGDGLISLKFSLNWSRRQEFADARTVYLIVADCPIKLITGQPFSFGGLLEQIFRATQRDNPTSMVSYQAESGLHVPHIWTGVFVLLARSETQLTSIVPRFRSHRWGGSDERTTWLHSDALNVL